MGLRNKYATSWIRKRCSAGAGAAARRWATEANVVRQLVVSARRTTGAFIVVSLDGPFGQVVYSLPSPHQRPAVVPKRKDVATRKRPWICRMSPGTRCTEESFPTRCRCSWVRTFIFRASVRCVTSFSALFLQVTDPALYEPPHSKRVRPASKNDPRITRSARPRPMGSTPISCRTTPPGSMSNNADTCCPQCCDLLFDMAMGPQAERGGPLSTPRIPR